ncbi:MAG: hypothetical protein COA96_16660, partial [SAR86 cluster bacterium]
MNTGKTIRFSRASRLRSPSMSLSLLLCFALAALSPELRAQTSNVQAMQELVQRWIVIEHQETALVTNWQQQQQILQQRLQLLGEEKNQLNAILSDNSSDSDTVNQRRLSLLELQNTMEND